MTDRELLEMAAKAAGVSAYWSTDGTIQARPLFVVSVIGATGEMPYEEEWNPLKSDGDALRLAVKLGIDIETHGCNSAHPFACAFDCERNIAEEEQPDNGDPYAATRRAIVRAAAEIGRAMP